VNIKLGKPILVHAPEMNSAVARWGVYAIPRMWRERTGELVIRFNGEADSTVPETMQAAPNLYFFSRDEGKTWARDPDGEQHYDIGILTGIEPPCLRLRNGDLVYLQYEKDLLPVENTPWQKEFEFPNHDSYMRTYRYGDIPAACKKLWFCRVDGKTGELTRREAVLDFPERELALNYLGREGDEFVPVPEYVQPNIFASPYISAMHELPDGTLCALSHGQNPEVHDRYCKEIYLMVSEDGGGTWKKRATAASSAEMPFGYGGDAGECSLAVMEDGSLFCVMRMDMSIHPDEDETKCWGTAFCASFDGGFTWTEPKLISDSSVTPHITAHGDKLLVIYGRPGVHCIASCDRGETWSGSVPIIGKTLSEERALGRSDPDSKYFASCSYSNTFIEQLTEDTVLVCYNDQTYPDKNGVPTKACFVRTVTVG